MFTTSKIFFDSSVFIEGSKETHPAFLKTVTDPQRLQGFINAVVCSEVWYIFLGLMGGVSPLTLKQKAANQSLFMFYQQYTILPETLAIVENALEMIKKYNLLPNDALILSTCVVNNISQLASHDPDFETACTNEGIALTTPKNYLERLPQS